MRNVPPRVPYEKLAFSQPIKVKTKHMNRAQQIGIEEDEYLKEMNQFYLDYHNYEQKRLYFMQLKHIQSIINQERIIKSTFNNMFLDQFNQRKNNALKILNEPIFDNSELEKDVIALESKVLKYQKALKQRSTPQYLFGDLYSYKSNSEKNLKIAAETNSNLNGSNYDNQNLNKYTSIESKVLQTQLQNDEKEIELQRRNIILNQQLKSINNELYLAQKTLQLYKTKRYKPIFYNNNEPDKPSSSSYISEIQEAIINQRKAYLQEKNSEILQMKEEMSIIEKQNQDVCNELENQIFKLTDKLNIVDQSSKELFQINEEIEFNKIHLLNLKNEFYDVSRKFKSQNEDIQKANQNIHDIKARIASNQVLLSEKEREINQKRKEIEQKKQSVDILEKELITMKKLVELKQKNIHFIQNRIDSQMKGVNNIKNPIKRMLHLDSLGLKKNMVSSNKPFSIRRNENIIPNQM